MLPSLGSRQTLSGSLQAYRPNSESRNRVLLPSPCPPPAWKLLFLQHAVLRTLHRTEASGVLEDRHLLGLLATVENAWFPSGMWEHFLSQAVPQCWLSGVGTAPELQPGLSGLDVLSVSTWPSYLVGLTVRHMLSLGTQCLRNPQLSASPTASPGPSKGETHGLPTAARAGEWRQRLDQTWIQTPAPLTVGFSGLGHSCVFTVLGREAEVMLRPAWLFSLL